MNKMGGMCFDWKVLAALAVVGVGVWVVAPSMVWAALPLLLLAACPISMLLMMRGMQGSHCSSAPAQGRGDGGARDEQLAALEAQLAGMRAQQEAITRALAELAAASAPVVREAEMVARAADEAARGDLEGDGRANGQRGVGRVSG